VNSKKRASPPVVLTIAGSDNSCGAGLQADLKTITALGGYGLTTATCVVAEVPGRVSMIQSVTARIVAEQIRLSFAAFPVAAIKTGMLFSAAIIEAVHAALLAGAVASKQKPALVIDPVMVASSGDPLLKPSAIRACRRLLFPLASLVTPNLGELETLSGQTIRSLEEMEAAGRTLAAQYRVPFLLKGGHLQHDKAVDLLIGPDGRKIRYEADFIRGADPHGTGCAYSAAIATGLAHGHPLPDAIADAKEFITRAIRQRHRWKTTEALDHSAPPAA